MLELEVSLMFRIFLAGLLDWIKASGGTRQNFDPTAKKGTGYDVNPSSFLAPICLNYSGALSERRTRFMKLWTEQPTVVICSDILCKAPHRAGLERQD
jgi:hypothetical protein